MSAETHASDSRRNEAELVAGFGQARLVKMLDGKYELRGGSHDDRLAAQEWISMFFHESIVKEV
jgi:hypothetical protein